MAHFIFSHEDYLAKLMECHKLSHDESNNLLSRLGVRQERKETVTMIVISKNDFIGFDVLFDLIMEYEDKYKKNVDPTKLKVVVIPTMEDVSKSPRLERASFILTLEDSRGLGDLLGVEHYPELGKILPFKEVE